MAPTSQQSTFIRWLEEIGIQDILLVGGKNASLGEMYQELASKGVKVRNRFAIDRPSLMLGSRKFLKIFIRTISPNRRQLR